MSNKTAELLSAVSPEAAGTSPAAFGHSKRREALAAYGFIAPVMVGFVVFVLGPLIAAIVLSVTKYNITSQPRFVGFDNFVRMLGDERLAQSYANTFLYVVAAVILINFLALLFAALISQNLPGWLVYVFRSSYFFPSLVALVYVSIIWQSLFQKDTGIINFYLTSIGGPRLDWLNGTELSKVSVIIVDTWRNVGFAMLIYVAALQEVPKEMLEAAEMDGANAWKRFTRISIPMISQATFFNITTTVIGAFQIYESIIVLTGGGPGDSSRSIVMYIAEKAFSNFDMGYASAIAVTLFVLIMLATLLQFRIRRSWVHYE